MNGQRSRLENSPSFLNGINKLEIRRTCARLKQEGPPKNSLLALLLMTAVLLIVAVPAF